MKLLLSIAALALLAGPALAADAPPTPKPATPTCGKTAEECQKTVDFLQAALVGAQQQRDTTQKALADLQLQDYAAKTVADKVAQAEADKKPKK